MNLMTKVSRIPMEEKIREDVWWEFWWALDSLKIKELLALFQKLLTSTEIAMFSKRLAVLKTLRKKIDYSSIRQSFKVTDPTIA